MNESVGDVLELVRSGRASPRSDLRRISVMWRRRRSTPLQRPLRVVRRQRDHDIAPQTVRATAAADLPARPRARHPPSPAGQV